MLFIAVCALLYGILSFTRPWLISQGAKQFLLLSVFVSGIVNFGLLSDNTLKYTEYGGYISAPVLEIGKLLFATNIVIIQGIIVIGLISTIIRILMSTNIELPSFPKVDFKVPEKPEVKEHQIINNKTSSGKIQINNDAYKNIAESTTKVSASDGMNLKSVLKAKLLDKLSSRGEQTLPEIQLAKPIITFPKDKPSFPVKLLHMSDDNKQVVDEMYIASKAEVIKAKLAEFGIMVEIAGYNI